MIDIVQIHGDEDEAYVKTLKKEVFKPVIKTIRVKEQIKRTIQTMSCLILSANLSMAGQAKVLN
ncbi:MAG: hypothetical protein EHM20_16935 [Alphaproteobacteria bacterium]|nr:MAG: hypothetical protein EHM20_16935 [Alphaproteobacteria bacterium]